MIECKQILGVLPNKTSSPPIICETNDGVYYVKYVENISRNKVLVNEYICYQFAEILGLPIPQYSLVSMDNFLGKTYQIYDDSVVFNCPVAFGTKEVGRMSLSCSEQSIMDSHNKTDYLKIIALDYFVDNKDRIFNLGNLLFTPFDKKTWAIDFTHVFGNDTIWDRYSCKRKEDDNYEEFGFENDSIYQYMVESFRFTKEHLDEIRLLFSKINENIIETILDSVPKDWGCPQEDLDALKLYLIKRLSRLEQVVDIIERRIIWKSLNVDIHL